jgi:hypothetical protein
MVMAERNKRTLLAALRADWSMVWLRAAQTALILMFLAAMIRVLWVLWPYNVMVLREPIQVITPRVVAGEEIQYRLSYCKNPRFGEMDAEVRHTFLDGLIHSVPSVSGPLPSGCHTVIVSLPMPKLPSGLYTLTMDRRYKVNPIREVLIDSRSQPFYVYSR